MAGSWAGKATGKSLTKMQSVSRYQLIYACIVVHQIIPEKQKGNTSLPY
jgi:hypothetical protein